ncbi:MAG TPA: sodium transporter, partial [Pricia sp.]|nr:sodium transporter [Pricia sp.]
SVKTHQDAKKVGLTFGWLYLVSPIIWMLPPMIYRILNPDLSGLEVEEAYMLICKRVLPVGMLGLMLGGMVFATASSVNTTLNMAASIITNDIFKVLRPAAGHKQIMFVARLSTLLFGVGTIAIALLVPFLGGIVNVVLSVGAVTGCSLYGPPIWALFSKRIAGRAVLIITFVSLAINIGTLLAHPLNRANEMLLGALSPFFLLAGYEVFMILRKVKSGTDYQSYEKSLLRDSKAKEEDSSQNVYGLKVLSNTLLTVSVLIIILGIISSGHGLLIASTGFIILVVAFCFHPSIKL